MELFKNSNGKNYEIIKESGSYTLLKELGNDDPYRHPYVIAYGLDRELKSWSTGRYRSYYKEAKKEFQRLIK